MELRHYDVQLIGGMALNDGCVAEMRTGEEYKEEAYRAFSRLVDSIYEDSLRAVLRLPVEGAGAAPGGLSEEDDPFRPEGMVYSDSRSDPGAPPLEAPDPAGGNPLG